MLVKTLQAQVLMHVILKRINRFDKLFLNELDATFASCSNVANIGSWYGRLDGLTLALKQGKGSYRQVEDHIFELKVANYLHITFPGIQLTYEPRGIKPDGRNCDIHAQLNDRRVLVEIKSFHPERRARAIPYHRIAPHNNVVMDAESYHGYQATRGHLIDVTYETEEKISNYPPVDVRALAIPTGFHLDEEDVRDFVQIYRYGKPRPDDPLGPMTIHNLRGPFAGSVDEFWTFPFPQEEFGFRKGDTPRVIGPRMHLDRPIEIGTQSYPPASIVIKDI